MAGIAIPAALIGHQQRLTVAVTAQAPPGVAAVVRADAKAAGLLLTVQPAADRAAAVRLVEQGKATAAVAAGGETIWKARPSSALQPVLTAAIQQAVTTQRAAALGCPRPPPPGCWHQCGLPPPSCTRTPRTPGGSSLQQSA